MSLRSNRKPYILIDLDSELAESAVRIGDYIPVHSRHSFLERLFSILLMTLMMEDIGECTDAFERLHAPMIDSLTPQEANGIWGEYMQLQKSFEHRYRHQKYLLAELEELLPADLRVFPEDMFVIAWRAGGTLLLVG